MGKQINMFFLLMAITNCHGIKLDANSTTARIWAHIKSKGGALVLERPKEGKGQDEVTLSLFILNVRTQDETHMELVYDVYMRCSWLDERISYDEGPGQIVLPMNMAKDLIWMPDIFVTNAQDIVMHAGVDTYSGVRFTREGKVRISAKMTITAHCPMDFRRFPHDKQNCSLDIESYMFTAVDLKLKWGSVTLASENKRSTQMFTYTLQNTTIEAEQLATGTFERASIKMSLTRSNHHYTVLVYVPSIILVILSTLLFWLPLSALLERTLLGAVLLFCMVVILAASQYGTPQVGYLKAIDIWVVGCFTFLATALLEVIILHLMFGRELLAGRPDQFELMSEDEAGKGSTNIKLGPWLVRPDVAHKIDLSLRVIYPASYVIFNAIYWGVCTA